ncbi:four-jointed box protein 1-like [Haliotis asinina]|uniref:four-jointed box protein 1-like n=1 Tax=Haliotis asinina TaxID=109174 RepID=UPI003531AA5D
MRFVVIVMTGIGFTFGVIIGLFFQLPVDTLPADSNFIGSNGILRHRRSLRGLESPQGQYTLSSDTNADNERTLSKPIPIGSPDQEIGLGSFVHNANNIGRKDSVFFDVNENHPSRNSDQVQSNYGQSKQESDSVRSAGDRSPGGRVDTGASLTKNQASVSLRVKVKSNSKVAAAMEKNSKATAPVDGDQALGLARMTSGIHWARDLESQCPRGFTKTDSDAWRIKTKSASIVKMEEGCGRMQNRLVTFDDASKACVRYRLNTDQIQGEIYSYYLAKLLNMTNLPPSSLHRVDRVSDKWKSVHLDIADSMWADGKVVILTEWVDNLSPAYIPEPLKENSRRIHPFGEMWRGKPLSHVCDLMQWSDLIVFDYLTANLDRMVNNMFNRQWNEQMMNNPAHNLERDPSGNLLFLDNESGLFHGYRLLDKYTGYHSALLKSLCVYKQSTVEAVKKLYRNDNIGTELHRLFSEEETLHSSLPDIPQKNIKILKERLKDVYDQISQCELQYGS